MKIDLKNKVALITGASRGIGKAIALELGRIGMDVIINYVKNRGDAEQTVTELYQNGCNAVAIQADIGNVNDVLRLGDVSWNTFGRIDYLVNNAGIALTKHFLDCSLEDFESLNAVNFRGTFLLSQVIAKKMIQNNIPGSIYTITSINGIQPGVGKALYGATKGALETLMKGVALDLSPHNIKINTLAVGAIETDMTAAVIKDDQFLKRVEAGIPFGRLGKPEEVAKVIAALLVNGSYITGSTIIIDGGWLLKNGYAIPYKYEN